MVDKEQDVGRVGKDADRGSREPNPQAVSAVPASIPSRGKPIAHREFETARTTVARALARANRTGTVIRCENSDIRTVLYGMVAIQAENAALRHDLERCMARNSALLNGPEGPQ